MAVKDPMRIKLNHIDCIRYDAESMIISFRDIEEELPPKVALEEEMKQWKRKAWQSYPATKKPMEDSGKFSILFDKNFDTPEKAKQFCDAIERWKQSEEWTKQNGNFIPNVITFIEKRRYMDECTIITQTKKETPMLSPEEQANLLRRSQEIATGESLNSSSKTEQKQEFTPEELWTQVKVIAETNPNLAKIRAKQLIDRGIQCPESLRTK